MPNPDPRYDRQPQCLEYEQLIWGDLVYGTKEQLQAMCIGEGMVFPGEAGGRVKGGEPCYV